MALLKGDVDTMPEKFYTLTELQEIAANLDNFIADQTMLERKSNMASEYRRVIIGWNMDGSPIKKQLVASSQDLMNDKIVQEYINSGRIYEFIPKQQDDKITPEPFTLKTYSEKWLNRKRKLKPTTKANYQKYIDKIITFLGDKLLTEISVDDVQDMLDNYSVLSHKTLKDMKEILHQILKYAISDGIISKNPCESVDLEIPSDKVTVREALPIEQFRDILSQISLLRPSDRCYLGLIMYTAMRRGEALGLQWEDIDFDREQITISRNVTHPQQNSPVIGTPKTKAGYRVIPLDKNLKALLEPLKSSGYVIGGEYPLTLSAFRAMNKRINSTINMHGATAHILRHSYLTYAVGETTDFKTVQGISGHSDMGTLINRYAHPQQDKLRQLVDAVHSRIHAG